MLGATAAHPARQGRPHPVFACTGRHQLPQPLHCPSAALIRYATCPSSVTHRLLPLPSANPGSTACACATGWSCSTPAKRLWLLYQAANVCKVFKAGTCRHIEQAITRWKRPSLYVNRVRFSNFVHLRFWSTPINSRCLPLAAPPTQRRRHPSPSHSLPLLYCTATGIKALICGTAAVRVRQQC